MLEKARDAVPDCDVVPEGDVHDMTPEYIASLVPGLHASTVVSAMAEMRNDFEERLSVDEDALSGITGYD